MLGQNQQNGSLLKIAIGLIIMAGQFLTLNGKLVVEPENQAFLINTSVEIKCQTDSLNITPILYTISFESSESKIIYNGQNLLPAVQDYIRVSPQSFNGRYNVVIRGTTRAGGHYACTEPGSLETRSAEIVILHSDPFCNKKSNCTHIILTCTIHFSGNWPPEMHWTVDGAELTDNCVTHRLLGNESLTSTLVLPRDFADNLISCKTNFTLRFKPSTATATNVPEYTYTWKSPVTKSASLPIASGPGEKTLPDFGEVVALVTGMLVTGVPVACFLAACAMVAPGAR